MSNPDWPSQFSHMDEAGAVRMVDVGTKRDEHRVAIAEGTIHCRESTIIALRAQALPKGDVLTVAKIAAIQAAKRTAELIPLCHSLALTGVDVTFDIDQSSIRTRVEVSTNARTGVEMEALTAVSVAALTIYDMCKA